MSKKKRKNQTGKAIQKVTTYVVDSDSHMVQDPSFKGEYNLKKSSGQVILTPADHTIKHTSNIEQVKTISELISTVSFDWNDDARVLDLVSVIRSGIDYNTFRLVTAEFPFNDNDWAVILNTTTRTLDRYKKDNKAFASKQSETIIEIKQLMLYGQEVFGNTPNFHSWLMMENVALGGVVPKDLLDTSVGVSMIKDFLGRIEHGVLA